MATLASPARVPQCAREVRPAPHDIDVPTAPRRPMARGEAARWSGRAAPLAALFAALIAGVAFTPSARALETPVAGPSAAATPGANAARASSTVTVRIGALERAIEVDWARARAVALDLNASRTRLAPSADAPLKALANELALNGDKRERYVLYARAADPKPSTADLQLSARVVRNGLIAAAGAPQDAIVVASWTGTGDPPALAATLGTTAPVNGFVLVPIRSTGDANLARALALDSAFSGVAELVMGQPSSTVAVAPPQSPSPPASVSTPTPPARPVVAAIPPAPPAKATTSNPPERTGSIPSASRIVAAVVPLPKARPATAASAHPTAASALPTAMPEPRPEPPRVQASAPPPVAAPRAEARPRPVAPRAASIKRPEPPTRPSTRLPIAKTEPARRAPTRVADCAPPRLILDDFYPGGPFLTCDGRRR